MHLKLTVGVAGVAKSKSFGDFPLRRSLTGPPAKLNKVESRIKHRHSHIFLLPIPYFVSMLLEDAHQGLDLRCEEVSEADRLGQGGHLAHVDGDAVAAGERTSTESSKGAESTQQG